MVIMRYVSRNLLHLSGQIPAVIGRGVLETTATRIISTGAKRFVFIRVCLLACVFAGLHKNDMADLHQTWYGARRCLVRI